jgi:hypothetical protein
LKVIVRSGGGAGERVEMVSGKGRRGRTRLDYGMLVLVVHAAVAHMAARTPVYVVWWIVSRFHDPILLVERQ